MVSLKFFGFLAGAFLIHWFIPNQRARSWFLSGVSLAFIFVHDRAAAVIVVALSLYATAMGALIAKTGRAIVHRTGVIGVLLVLIVFKYLGLLEGTINSLAQFVGILPVFDINKLILPLGISYITFKCISYLTDIHWKIITPGRFDDVLCYGSLFTIFVAGPIERFERFGPQLSGEPRRLSLSEVEYGLTRIGLGLVKKLVFADWIGYLITPVWNAPEQHSLVIRALALLGYAFQIYLDFAGYSDIAIGSSRLLGLKIMENFNWPYLQPNMSKFWQGWHISLSEWIRDYLFFPLGHVSRTKFWSIVVVPIVAMALCGLWHGAAWHFVVWGVWHGAGLAMLQFWNGQKRTHKSLAKLSNTRAFTIASTIATFLFVTIGWLWFRS
jgi:alginate O-acetyltransferase complex protein AlgI